MTQGELEQIPLSFESRMSSLEIRIMSEVVRAIKINGFSTATADHQIQMLAQLGKSEKDIRQCVQSTLKATDEEIDRIFSDTVYEYYYGYNRAYELFGSTQVPFEKNLELQTLLASVREQTKDTFRNMTASMGFAIRNPASGKLIYSPLMDFYRNTLDDAVMDIMSGTASYDKALSRAVNTMTNSGIRWIDYDSGWHNRVNVAARRAVMTGFRQVQGKINEQVAKELGTDSYEVTYHVGARPSHQLWQGRVWTYEQLVSVCGLGSVTGLHGANCYHDYNAFIPGVSVRTYTDEQLEQMIAEENTPKSYNGKEYTTYEALQEQRKMETAMRKTRQDIKLLQDGGAERDTIILKQARYQGQMQQYKSFSKAIGLPEQKSRVYLDGLGKAASSTKKRYLFMEDAVSEVKENYKMYNSGLSTESLLERCKKAQEINNKYTTRESKWSGNLVIDDKKCKKENVSGRKLWSCDILLLTKCQDKTVIHEELHSRSGSYLNPLTYIRYGKMEEASVEFLAREICKKEKIPFRAAEDMKVSALYEINNITQICDTDLDFAQALFAKSLKTRYNWLEKQVGKYIKNNLEDSEKLNELLSVLKGAKL